MDEATERVTAQYTKYSYPAPLSDLDELAASGRYIVGDPAAYSALIWPEGRPRADLRILVAGCGTSEAALIARNNPSCSVLGIDVSETSLSHCRSLKEQHGLDNLQLERLDLRDLPGERPFDYILCHGVLHHLSDPGRGLRALASVLSPQGAASVMLYGRAARAGIYLLQDVFRRAGVKQDAQGVAFVRHTLQQLPPIHYIHKLLGNVDLSKDSTIVDAFLHVQDRAYSVPEVLDFVRRNGLVFQSWVDAGNYSIDKLPNGGVLEAEARKLPLEDQWAIVEAITLAVDRHTFLVCHPQRDPDSYSVSCSGDAFLDLIPVRHHTIAISKERMPGTDRMGVIRDTMHFTVAPGGAFLLLTADGRKTIGEILQAPQLASVPAEKRVAGAREFFERMWRNGHIFLSRVPVR
jgi:SAM-dependent methyltransferase